jgi:hypothetical protein
VDIDQVIVELRGQLELIDQAILTFERLASGGNRVPERQSKLPASGRGRESRKPRPSPPLVERGKAMSAGSDSL